jgi:hypothetical protein
MTYFHRCTSTIIGAKAFHGPVREGKGWYRLAMVVKRSLYCFSNWGEAQGWVYGVWMTIGVSYSGVNAISFVGTHTTL